VHRHARSDARVHAERPGALELVQVHHPAALRHAEVYRFPTLLLELRKRRARGLEEVRALQRLVAKIEQLEAQAIESALAVVRDVAVVGETGQDAVHRGPRELQRPGKRAG